MSSFLTEIQDRIIRQSMDKFWMQIFSHKTPGHPVAGHKLDIIWTRFSLEARLYTVKDKNWTNVGHRQTLDIFLMWPPLAHLSLMAWQGKDKS